LLPISPTHPGTENGLSEVRFVDGVAPIVTSDESLAIKQGSSVTHPSKESSSRIGTDAGLSMLTSDSLNFGMNLKIDSVNMIATFKA
jgi:hypothetical protein